MEFSDRAAFSSVGCEVCWVCEVFVERIGYGFVGDMGGVVEGYGTVGICGGGKFVIEGFYGFPVYVLILFVVPWCIHMVLP